MENIYIIGVGGFAKEVLGLINDLNEVKPRYNISGFVGMNETSNTVSIVETYPIIEERMFLNDATKYRNACLAIGIGTPSILEKISKKFVDFHFPNLVHPSVNGYFQSIKMGQGNIITAGCNITVDIQIGSFNIFNLNSTVGHDSKIEDFNVINPGSNISGGVSIGSGNLFGTNSTVLQNLSIGSKSVLGAGAVLTKNLGSNKLAIGIPAKPIKDL